METHNCPWCGKDLRNDWGRCAFCGWTREGKQKNRSVKYYVGFLIFSFVIGIGIFIYALKYVMEPTNHLAGTKAIHFEEP